MLQSPTTPHKFLKKLPKRLAVVDQNACSGCAGSPSCVAFCETVTVKDAVVDAIRVTRIEGHPFELAYIEFDKCIGCAICAQVCPWDAITMYDTTEAYDVLDQVTLRPADVRETPEPVTAGA
jgi:formate hydrogenlyase subunit 6/NADH:ubiquinone oxidoreductase subunit I